jgi:heavy metal sensor kinase
LNVPLRVRLTLWYLLTLAAILALFLAFLYWQTQRSLLAQMDGALRIAAGQALVSVEAQGNRLAFQDVANDAGGDQLEDDFVIYLLDSDGTVWDLVGEPEEFSPHLPRSGVSTLTIEGDPWRVYSQRIPPSAVNAGDEGWIQVAQEMDQVSDALASLRAQMLLGLPLALLLAGVGGYLLAWRALRPIERITRTAQTINAGDLSRRIDYHGPADEVGRLAATFDNMLGRLESAFERQRRFTADAAHELRTPLTALKGRIEVTLNRPRSQATYTETLEEMSDQVDRLIRLSSDLLFMARLDRADYRTVHAEKVQVEGLLLAVIDQVAPLAARKGIALEHSIAADLSVEGDLDLLIRLFLNLLDNAIKYTPTGGRVAVQAQKTGGQVVINTSDTGPGVPAEALPHLFQRFYRVEEDRARFASEEAEGGAGLGLAIAAEIVRVHGGTIEVQSEMGEGATFTVMLPAVGE